MTKRLFPAAQAIQQLPNQRIPLSLANHDGCENHGSGDKISYRLQVDGTIISESRPWSPELTILGLKTEGQ